MNPHLNEKASIRNLPPSKKPEVGILAIHGRNQDPDFILNICDRLGWDSLPIIAPAAAENSWYPGGFMDPIHENEPHLTHALEAIQHKLDELKNYGLREDQIILLGFSQGACLASEFAARTNTPFKAMVFLTGGLIGEQLRSDYSGDFNETPLFITTSEIDEWVPASRVQETADVFRKLNARVEMVIYEDRPHQVSEDEIVRIKEMISLS